jgi:hypothetical protein
MFIDMYTASNDPASNDPAFTDPTTTADPIATADPTATNNEETCELNSNEKVLQLLVSGSPTLIRDNAPELINENPSRDVLNRLSAMVREGLHSGVSMEILIHYCGSEGRALAEELVNEGY